MILLVLLLMLLLLSEEAAAASSSSEDAANSPSSISGRTSTLGIMRTYFCCDMCLGTAAHNRCALVVATVAAAVATTATLIISAAMQSMHQRRITSLGRACLDIGRGRAAH